MALCLLGHHLRVRFSVLKLRHFISPSFRLVTWLQGPKHEVLLIFRIDKVTMWASYQREGTTSTLLWLRWGGWLLINFSSFIEIPRMFNFVLILISSARVLHWLEGMGRVTWSFDSHPFLSIILVCWHLKFYSILLVTSLAHERVWKYPFSLRLSYLIEHVNVVKHLRKHLIDLLSLPLNLFLTDRVIFKLLCDYCRFYLVVWGISFFQ